MAAMTSRATSAFSLTAAHKATPELTAADDEHFAAITNHLDHTVATLTDRLAALRRSDGGGGRRALDRDLEIHDVHTRLATLRRHRVDLCLGRVSPDDGEPYYIGRIGLTDLDGHQLLVDWRTPAAAPFFAATHGNRLGIASRRRYRWEQGRIIDFWDEVFRPDAVDDHVVLDEDSAFLAGLESSRSARMRDVLGTIAADQDTIIRADSHGALVVDGGPGTGKTVVALHRAAYLLYADPRLAGNRGGLLVVGPHDPYLGYISDVLPSLGEEGVATATLRDLLPEGAGAVDESDSYVRQLKSSIDPIAAIDRAVAFYESPPTTTVDVETPWDDVQVTSSDWAEAFRAVDPGTPHNEAREDIWDSLVEILGDKHAQRPDARALRNALTHSTDLVEELNRAWPLLDAPTLVGDLWSVSAYLRLAAPELSAAEVRALHRPAGARWTVTDLPLLDAARRRLGDPEFSRRVRRRAAAIEADRAEMDDVVDQLIDAHTYDDGEGLAQMLRHTDMRGVLVHDTEPRAHTDPLAGPFAHIIVDEAQELTDAGWTMLLSRCPSKSFTIVGDRAQAREGFSESWQERLSRIGFGDIAVSGLSVNYRTPEEIMEHAAPVIRAALPDANVPTSIRSSGRDVRHGTPAELTDILTSWLAEHADGTVCVIGASAPVDNPRVRSLSPTDAKGLEFDFVVLVEPDRFGDGITGAVDRYVAMTRATRELWILSDTQ